MSPAITTPAGTFATFGEAEVAAIESHQQGNPFQQYLMVIPMIVSVEEGHSLEVVREHVKSLVRVIDPDGYEYAATDNLIIREVTPTQETAYVGFDLAAIRDDVDDVLANRREGIAQARGEAPSPMTREDFFNDILQSLFR